MVKEVACRASITDKVFVTDKGDSIGYYEIVLNINGAQIHVSVKEKDKGLLAFVLNGVK